MALKKIPPLDLDSHAMDFQLFSQERLLIEEIPSYEDKRLVMSETLADSAVPNLAKDTVSGIDLQSQCFFSSFIVTCHGKFSNGNPNASTKVELELAVSL